MKTKRKKSTRLLGKLQSSNPRKLNFQIAALFMVLVGIIGVVTLTMSKAAYAYTTLYSPNSNANATLLACMDTSTSNTQLLRLKYVGNDSPFIRMRTTFDPNKLAGYTQRLAKYKQNWTWEGQYNVPAGASSVTVDFTFDDNTKTSGGSALSSIVKCTTETPPATPPTATITAPATGATVSGKIDILANATDNTGVRSVQFHLDNADLGGPDTTSPYSTPLDTTTITNGTHTVTAIATNTAGLTSAASLVTITVNNSTPAPAPSTSIKQFVPGTSWDWIISTTPTSANLDKSSNPRKMIDIDLENNTASTISSFKSKGIAVVCYYSAGSYENWRSDANRFPASVIGKSNGWAGENWLDIRSPEVLTIMKARMDIAVQKGCDGVEPDNVDGYTNTTGFPLTASDQLKFNTSLANEAHARGLSIALKNDVDQVTELAKVFDFALNEQCVQYNECQPYTAFTNLNKAVFNAEYRSLSCDITNKYNIDSVLFALDLNNSKYQSCR